MATKSDLEAFFNDDIMQWIERKIEEARPKDSGSSFRNEDLSQMKKDYEKEIQTSLEQDDYKTGKRLFMELKREFDAIPEYNKNQKKITYKIVQSCYAMLEEYMEQKQKTKQVVQKMDSSNENVFDTTAEVKNLEAMEEDAGKPRRPAASMMPSLPDNATVIQMNPFDSPPQDYDDDEDPREGMAPSMKSFVNFIIAFFQANKKANTKVREMSRNLKKMEKSWDKDRELISKLIKHHQQIESSMARQKAVMDRLVQFTAEQQKVNAVINDNLAGPSGKMADQIRHLSSGLEDVSLKVRHALTKMQGLDETLEIHARAHRTVIQRVTEALERLHKTETEVGSIASSVHEVQDYKLRVHDLVLQVAKIRGLVQASKDGAVLSDASTAEQLGQSTHAIREELGSQAGAGIGADPHMNVVLDEYVATVRESLDTFNRRVNSIESTLQSVLNMSPETLGQRVAQIEKALPEGEMQSFLSQLAEIRQSVAQLSDKPSQQTTIVQSDNGKVENLEAQIKEWLGTLQSQITGMKVKHESVVKVLDDMTNLHGGVEKVPVLEEKLKVVEQELTGSDGVVASMEYNYGQLLKKIEDQSRMIQTLRTALGLSVFNISDAQTATSSLHMNLDGRKEYGTALAASKSGEKSLEHIDNLLISLRKNLLDNKLTASKHYLKELKSSIQNLSDIYGEIKTEYSGKVDRLETLYNDLVGLETGATGKEETRLFKQGVASFYAGNFVAAEKFFNNLLAIKPEHIEAQFYIKECRSLIKSEPAKQKAEVEAMQSKTVPEVKGASSPAVNVDTSGAEQAIEQAAATQDAVSELQGITEAVTAPVATEVDPVVERVESDEVAELYGKGLLAMQEKQYDNAQSLFSDVLKKRPHHIGAKRLLRQCESRAGQPTPKESVMTTSDQVSKDSVSVQSSRPAVAKVAKENKSKADEQSISPQQKSLDDMAYKRSIKHIQEGKHDTASKILKRLLKTQPTNLTYRSMLLRCEQYMGGSVPITADEAPGNDFDSVYKFAMDAYVQGDISKAAKLFKHSLQISPHHFGARKRLLDCVEILKSEKSVDRAQSAAKDAAAAMIERVKSTGSVRSDANVEASRIPDDDANPALLYSTGLDMFRNGNILGAKEKFEQALSLDPKNANATRALSLVTKRMEAIDAQGGGSADSDSSMGEISRSPETIEESDDSQNRLDSLYRLGMHAYTNGSYDVAAKSFLSIVQANPDMRRAHIRLGELYQKVTSQKLKDEIIHATKGSEEPGVYGVEFKTSDSFVPLEQLQGHIINLMNAGEQQDAESVLYAEIRKTMLSSIPFNDQKKRIDALRAIGAEHITGTIRAAAYGVDPADEAANGSSNDGSVVDQVASGPDLDALYQQGLRALEQDQKADAAKFWIEGLAINPDHKGLRIRLGQLMRVVHDDLRESMQSQIDSIMSGEEPQQVEMTTVGTESTDLEPEAAGVTISESSAEQEPEQQLEQQSEEQPEEQSKPSTESQPEEQSTSESEESPQSSPEQSTEQAPEQSAETQQGEQ